MSMIVDRLGSRSLASFPAPVTCDANRSRGAYHWPTTGVEMTADGDQQRRGAALYPFPGGVFERWDDTDDAEPGVYVEFHHPRQSCNDARTFDPDEAQRLGLVDHETEPA